MSESGNYGRESYSTGTIFGSRKSYSSESVSTGESRAAKGSESSHIETGRSNGTRDSGPSAASSSVLKQFLKSNEDYIVEKAGPQVGAGFTKLYRLAIVKHEKSLMEGQAALTADLLVNMLESTAPLYPDLVPLNKLGLIYAWLREKQRDDQLNSSALKYW